MLSRRLAARAWPYAQIAYNSYHREEADARARPFKLPSRFKATAGGKHENDDIGLAYDVLTEDNLDGSFNLIFAFRGTEGGIDLLGLTECDWKYGNHRVLQHERALGRVKQYLVDLPYLPLDSARLKHVILVGHSLGGGIATHVSYRVPGAWVYGFNSSPKFFRPRPYEATATDEEWRRLSITTRGEVLKAVRLPAREATQLYLPVRCSGGGPLKRHSMLGLATCLTRIAAEQGNGSSRTEAAVSIATQPEQFSAARLKIDPDRSVAKCR